MTLDDILKCLQSNRDGNKCRALIQQWLESTTVSAGPTVCADELARLLVDSHFPEELLRQTDKFLHSQYDVNSVFRLLQTLVQECEGPSRLIAADWLKSNCSLKHAHHVILMGLEYSPAIFEEAAMSWLDFHKHDPALASFLQGFLLLSWSRETHRKVTTWYIQNSDELTDRVAIANLLESIGRDLDVATCNHPTPDLQT